MVIIEEEFLVHVLILLEMMMRQNLMSPIEERHSIGTGGTIGRMVRRSQRKGRQRSLRRKDSHVVTISTSNAHQEVLP